MSLSSHGIDLAHIVNPVVTNSDDPLSITQPITFESMRTAKYLAARANLSVSLYSAQFLEDREIVPQDFFATPDLKRSVLDCGSFAKPRKLPLIKDILDSLYHHSDADYLIYTNVDIILQPSFYVTVMKYIELGIDAFVINRRTITSNYTKIQELPLMYSEIGRDHPGFDCFVFRREIYPHYHLAKACIGVRYVGRILLLNLIAHSQRFQLFKNAHLTFHLGDDRTWNQAQYSDYTEHNRIELLKIKHELDFLLKRKNINTQF